MKLLIVEDDDDLRQMLQRRFAADYAVESTGDGLAAIELLKRNVYDLVLLDRMLPGADGLEVLKAIRQKKSRTYVLLLTARDSVNERVQGLNAGADDYLVKPFAFEELKARIHALERRRDVRHAYLLRVGDLSVNLETQKVRRGKKEISLTRKEYALLVCLMKHAGEILSRDQLIQYAWNQNGELHSNTLDVYINYLRGKIDAEQTHALIHTIKGRGYCLELR